MLHSAEDALLDSARRIIVDANVIIAFLDARHPLHSKVRARLNTIYLSGADFFYVQPCLLELREYWRRKMITECIDLQIAEGYNFYRKFKKAYDECRVENSRRSQLYLNDRQLKDLRTTLENIAGGKGVQYWLELCQQALLGAFDKIDSTLAASRFKYARFDDEDVFPKARRDLWPKWEGADALQEKFGLSSNDAAILNMVNGAHDIDGFVSNDGDLLFAVLNGALVDTVNAYTFLDITKFV